jgi:hypothetical protein
VSNAMWAAVSERDLLVDQWFTRELHRVRDRRDACGLLVLFGGRGSGKSSLLARLERRAENTYHARLDCEQLGQQVHGTVDVLARVVFQLRAELPTMPPLQLPAYAAMRLALAVETDPADRETALREMSAALEEGKGQERSVDLFVDLVEKVGAAAGLPALGLAALPFLAELHAAANVSSRTRRSPGDERVFAGRPPQLRMLVEALGSRSCAATGNRFRVITGSGASTVDSYVDKDRLDDWRRALGRVTVEYAAVGHPDAWGAKTKAPEAQDGGREVRTLEAEASKQLKLRKSELDDSRLMTIYDATRLAVKNIRHQAEGGKDSTGSTRIPGLGEVFSGWQQLRSANKVLGTTGWICLDNKGNAFNKAVALVRLDPAWKGDEKLRFDHVAWPTGAPLTATCTARRQN